MRRSATAPRMTDRLAHCPLCSASAINGVPMPSEGPEFFNMMIRAACISGDRRGAEDLLQRMVASGFAPGIRAFVPLISMCADAGDVEAIHGYLARMADFGVAANPCSLHGLMKGYALKRDLAGARRVMAIMRLKQFAVDEFTYHILVHTCAKTGQLAEAEQYVAEMEQLGIIPTVITYNCMIDVCARCRCKNLRRAQMWFRRMTEKGIHPNVITHGTLCKAHAAVGDVEGVENVIGNCEAAGRQPGIHFFVSLLHACERQTPRNKEHAERCLRMIVQRGMGTVPVFNRFSRILGRRRTERLRSEAHQMRSNSVQSAGQARNEMLWIGTLSF